MISRNGWDVSLIFNETEKTHDSVLLKESNSFKTKSEFTDIRYRILQILHA